MIIQRDEEEWISWDFDETLYDCLTGTYNEELLDIFEEQIDTGKNVCIVTLRTFDECPFVKSKFKNVRIFYTNGKNKADYLKYRIPIKVIKHYDNRLDTCLQLIGSSVTPVWVLGEREEKKLEKLEIVKFIEGKR